jgi:methanesulfonate monooxygenase small subunit
MIRQLPKHNSDPTPLTRHASVYRIHYDPARGEADALTSVLIVRTTLDAGVSDLYAAAKYLDTIAVNGTPRLVRRTVRLDTRMLGIGTHFFL